MLRAPAVVSFTCLLLVSCSSDSSTTTGPILPITSGEINSVALEEALNRSSEPEKLLIFKGNMTSGSFNDDQITAQLEAHVYAISLENEALIELTVDGEANAITAIFLEAFDRGASFSQILVSRPLLEVSPVEGYGRRGEISGVLERGQYVVVLWPTDPIRYRITAEWASP
jgi:hypothetical protein